MSFTPRGQQDLALRGEVARLNANLAALRTFRTRAGRPPPRNRRCWRVGRGGVRCPGCSRAPSTATTRGSAAPREQLRQVLDEREYAAAARNTLNAHYTDAALVQRDLGRVTGLGFDGRDVLEPGAGRATSSPVAPAARGWSGWSWNRSPRRSPPPCTRRRPSTASFADTRAADGAFDLAIGNVPFGKFALDDRRHNPAKSHDPQPLPDQKSCT